MRSKNTTVGLYDTLSFDSPLPNFPEGLDQNKLEFQTKDLECCMINYKVENSQLFEIRRKYNTIEDESAFFGIRSELISEEIIPLEFTGEVCFYTYLPNPDYNLWTYGGVEYKMIVIKGKVESITFLEHTPSRPYTEEELEKFAAYQAGAEERRKEYKKQKFEDLKNKILVLSVEEKEEILSLLKNK